MIEVTSMQIDRVNAILGGIQGAPQKAFSSTINRTLSTVRTNTGKMIRENYYIRQRDITSSQRMKMSKASSSNLEGKIEFAGTVIPLIKFKVNPTDPQQKAVTVSVLKDEGAKRLRYAYVADLGKYGPGVFERDTRKRASSRQLYGPSTAHMMEHEDILHRVDKLAQESVNKRIEHEISRILNGY